MSVWPCSQGMILDHDTLQGTRDKQSQASCLMFYAVCAAAVIMLGGQFRNQAQEMTCACMICMLCHS